MKRLSTKIKEESTAYLGLSFLDENGVAMTPKTATWTLSQTDGTIINSREDVSITTPGSTETVVLTGSDLVIVNDLDEEVRVFTVEGTYDDAPLTDLPFKDQVEFVIINMVVV